MTDGAPQAVVTGGAGDIGGAAAAALSQLGFATTLVDVVDPARGQSRAEELRDGAPLRYRRADTTSAVEVGAAVSDLDRLEVAVLCAGIVQAQPFLEIDPGVWRRHLEVNLTGAFVAAQASARQMIASGSGGHLIFVSSWVAERPWPEIGAYSASKAGMNQLMRTAALELAPLGVRANAVAPGIVMAGLARGQFENEPQYAARASRAIPLGTPQTTSQIADAIRFLASPAAASMTGSVLTVDAGCSLGTTH